MYSNAVYYPNWRIYRNQPPASLNFDVISHVFYAFAWYDPFPAFAVALLTNYRVKPDGTVYV
jgi:GH18 family chitinase